MKRRTLLLAFLTFPLLGLLLPLWAQRPRGQQPPTAPGTTQPPVAVLRPTVFAIRDARVVTEPGKVLPQATVVVREGLIEAVGPDVKAPADALILDGKGLTVYAGFIDALSNRGFDAALRRSEAGPAAVDDLASESLAATKPDNRKGMTPEFQVATALKVDEEQSDIWRKLGFTAHLVAPEGGIVVGQSALVSLSGAPAREALLRSPVGMHLALRAVQGGNEYPRALMGVIAHARQTLLDAGHYQRLWAAFEKNGRSGRRPPHDPSLAELALALNRKLPVIFEADTRDEIHRALDFAEEFNLQPILYGGQDAWKAVDRIKQKNVPVLLRLNFMEDGAGRFGRRFGPPLVVPSPEKVPTEREQPALPRRVEEDRQRQTKEQIQNAAVLHKHGVRFALSTQGVPEADKFRENLRKAIAEGLPADAALGALTTTAAQVLGVERQLGTVAPGKAAQLVITDGDFHEARTRVRYVFADGYRYEFPTADTPGKPDFKKSEKPKPEPVVKDDQPTEIEADRKPKIKTNGRVLITGATVLTVTNGTLRNVEIEVEKGKIIYVGPPKPRPPFGDVLINASGMYVMPGIIDTHSHFAVSGGVNEMSLSVVPEVRVRDVLNSEDVAIYRGLAGGVTTARLLHGSANVIGGQDAVIKLKYGEPASKLLVSDGPRGVKFALGENVKRTDGRFPNTRLGVEAVLVRAFTEAQAYRKTWETYQEAQENLRLASELLKKGVGDSTETSAYISRLRSIPEPRRDLRLEALADVLKGDLKVHSHCYRSDEILMLLRVADRFGFKVQSLQHVLEGYKIAPEIAAHGASNSTFSDWWAYKIEAYDAIPHNAALLAEAGAEVCLKSDSNELMRHLYQEAAKCMKYGGMSEQEALKTIPLHPAKQLGLDKRIGSIEVGKDADLVIFNGHPLNSYSRVEMTLVEGEVYFQRSDQLRAANHAQAGPSGNGKLKPIARSSKGDYALLGATVHRVSGPPLENSIVTISRGKITEVRSAKDGPLQVADDQVVVSAIGLHLYPGMIDAATVLGLTELGSARETQDYAEGGDFQPDLRASIGINPDSELIPVTRANGVTTVVTRPTGALIAGQGAIINLAGWVPREMVVVDPWALHVEFPTGFPSFSMDPNTVSVGRAVARKQREEKIRRLKELFSQALAYDEARKQAPARPVNPRLEALVPYARGVKPVVIQANRAQEIREALKLADELKIKIILSGAIDAWKVADELKKRDIPVIVGPIMALPSEGHDTYDAPYLAPKYLHEAGVKFCIRSGGSTNTRNLPYEAAMAVSYGLPPEEGLKAVTLYPAQILGVADQLGTIEAGKRANLVLTDGDLLQASTQVLGLFIDGRPVEPTNKQTRLYERYRERLREVKEGRAPLGTK